jgi:hypothetical protein
MCKLDIDLTNSPPTGKDLFLEADKRLPKLLSHLSFEPYSRIRGLRCRSHTAQQI